MVLVKIEQKEWQGDVVWFLLVMVLVVVVEMFEVDRKKMQKV